MGRLNAANAAARLVATPGSMVSTCPSLPASKTAISPSIAAISALSARQRAMLRPNRAARAAASAGGGRQARHRPIQNSDSLISDSAASSSAQGTQRGRPTGEGGGAVEHRLPDDAIDMQCPAVPVGSGQPRAERVQLVVQPLLGDLVLGDQATAVAHRGSQEAVPHQLALGPPESC